MVLKWFAKHCPDVHYLIKMDDDVFMNVPEVFNYLKLNGHSDHSIIGWYRKPDRPRRGGKWKITYEQMKEEHYPEYAFGPAVIYSNKFVRDAYHKSHTTRFFWVDDIFVSGFIRMQLYAEITKINERIWRRKVVQEFLKNDTFIMPKQMFLFTWNELHPNEHRLLLEKVSAHRDQY